MNNEEKLGNEVQFEDEEFTDLGTPELTDETITQEQINEMKMLGIDKPKLVSWDRWTRIQDIRFEHEHMIVLAASGLPQAQIAESMGYDQAHVSKILRTPEVKAKILDKIDDMYGDDYKKALKARNKKAVEVVDEILGPNSKESERAAMAKWVLEHSIGKASQEIQVKKTSLTEVLIKLEEMEKDGQLRNVGSSTELLSKPIDPFDTIIEEVIPKGMVIGKRSSSGGETE